MVGLTPIRMKPPVSNGGHFKGLWADATQVGMTPDPFIKHLNVVEHIGLGHFTGFVDPFPNSFLLQATENDSATALCQKLPRRLMLGSRFWASQKRCQSLLP